MAIQFLPLPNGVTWTHFRVVRQSPDGFDASTGYELAARFSTGGSAGTMRVSSVNAVVRLITADTWVVSGAQTAALLQHERLHYLMATLVGREMERELAAVTGADGSAVQQAVNALIAAKNDRALAMGAAYDDDSAHGTDRAQQAAWNTRVQGWVRNNNQINWP